MGFLVQDTIVIPINGLVLQNFVASVGGTIRGLGKETRRTMNDDQKSFTETLVYALTAVVRIWVSKDAYDQKLEPVMQLPVSFDLTDDEIKLGVFAVLYAKITAIMGIKSAIEI